MQQTSAPAVSVTDLHSPPTRDIDTNNLGQKVPPCIPPRPHTELLNRASNELGYVLPTHKEGSTTVEEDGKQQNSRQTDSDSISTTGSITSASTEGDDSTAPPIPPKMIPRSSSVHHQVGSSGPTTPVSMKSPPGGSPIKVTPSTPTSVTSLPALSIIGGGKSPPPIPKRNFSSMRGTPPPSGSTPPASHHSSQDSVSDNQSSA